ncbi:MAG: ATP-binding protein [Defluviitaleaceae bacterium]|nr:ATP-binding protein [Defluviitaleaceae bacterium]
MQKRIFINFVGLILVCVVLLVVSFGFLFFRAAQTHEMAAIRDKAQLVAELLNQNTDTNYEVINSGDTRITIISADGRALSDSHIGADLSVNRSDRTEFIQAVNYGSGEAIRASATLGADTFYYAIRLDNGNVLRLSRTLYSLGEVFTSTIPIFAIITIVILAVAYFIAYRLTRIIIKPLTEIDFDNSTSSESLYEELWPYMKKIDHQKAEIASQFATLRNRAETIDAIIANMREGLVMLDEKGLVLAVNKSVLDIFGISAKHDVVGQNIGYIYHDSDFMQGVKQCLGGAFFEMNFSRNNKFYNAFLSPGTLGRAVSEANDQPASGGAIVFILDTTEQHKADLQRKEFTANVSHELKTPLTTISALSEMMANGMAKADDVAGFSQKISDHTKRLMNIIDDIIRLSEFDESKVEKNFVKFDIYELAKTVIATLQDKAEEKSVSVELTGQPLQIEANNRLLDELIFNLLDNGIKYNKDGGNVTIDISYENDKCKISVTDTGIGIASQHQSRVFERFYRADASRSKKTGGTGLGLSIVKHIAEHHNGNVILESTEGVGTKVVCYIAI